MSRTISIHENSMKNNYRNSNIELLRILLMIGIIIHHSFVHSHIPIYKTNINYIILSVIQVLGIIGNNIFVLITGYYMVDTKIKKKSIVKLVLEVLFYSYSIFIIYVLITKKLDFNMVIDSLLPILSNSNWFITSYLLLYISILPINILIKNLDIKQTGILITISILLFSILPTITFLNQYFSCYIWFLILYIIGAFLKKYDCKELSKSDIIIIISISILSLLLFIFVFDINVIEIGKINNFIIFILSISIFVIFVRMKEWNNTKINYISSSVLAVYLIHDNFIIRSIIWKYFNIQSYLNKNYFFLYELAIIIFIFFICILIDKVRRRFIEEPILNIIENKVKNRRKK